MVQGFTAGGPGLYIPGLGTKILQVADRVKKKKKRSCAIFENLPKSNSFTTHTHIHTHKLFGHGKS